MNFIPSFAAIFYYFDDPKEKLESLVNAIRLWSVIPQEMFSHVSFDGERYKRFAGACSATEFLISKICSHNFDTSLCCELILDRNSDSISQQFTFWGRRIREGFKIKTPNYLYFQLPRSVPYDRCRSLFIDIINSASFDLGFGNYVVPTNPMCHPRSGSNSARFLRRSPMLLHEFNTTFRNIGYLQLLSQRASPFLLYPSQLFWIHPTFFESEQRDDLVQHRSENIPSLHSEASIIELCNTADLCSFNKTYKANFASVEKPLRYWKPDEWHEWLSTGRDVNSTKSITIGKD